MDYVFIKEGYSIAAALLGPVWLFVKGMFTAGGLYIGMMIIGSIFAGLIGLNAIAVLGLLLATNLAFGLFARDLHRFHLERQGYQFKSVVKGKSLDDCEIRYFRNRHQPGG